MGLPIVPLPRDTVEVAGVEVGVRGMSRSEVGRLGELPDYETRENWVLACGAEITEVEAAEWRAATDPETAGLVVDRICELSGLAEGARKSG